MEQFYNQFRVYSDATNIFNLSFWTVAFSDFGRDAFKSSKVTMHQCSFYQEIRLNLTPWCYIGNGIFMTQYFENV